MSNNIYSKEDMQKISNLLWEEKFIIRDPKKGKGFCSITKSKRYQTHIFKGNGSKNQLKRYIFYNKKYKAIAQIIDQKGFRQFVPFKSWEECWELYKHERYDSRYLYEMILSDRPCKPYLDINI